MWRVRAPTVAMVKQYVLHILSVAFIYVRSIPVVCVNTKCKTQMFVYVCMFVVLTVIYKHSCFPF
jgi:hypothetical protein